MEKHDDYGVNGFHVLKGCIPKECIAGVNRELLDFLARVITRKFDTGVRPGTIFEALSVIHGRDLEFYKSVIGSLWRFSPLSRLLRSSHIEAAVGDLLGSPHLFLPGGDVVHIMSPQLIIPGGYHGIGAHQDWPSVRGSKDGVVAWCPLTQVTSDTFPIEVIPGSHRHGIFPGVGSKERPWEISILPFLESDYIPVECNAGDVVIFSNFLIHRSARDGAPDAFRLALSTRFDNGLDWDYLNEGLPTAYKRVVDRLEI